MDNASRPRQRRRLILTCTECRKRKQKCDRSQPCTQCIARGPESICIYERFKPSNNVPDRGSSKASETSPSYAGDRASPYLQNIHEYGYSNSEPLTSMGMLTKVISGIHDVPSPQPMIVSRVRRKLRAEYFGYVRRLPGPEYCQILIDHFFHKVNHFNGALEEVVFREQLQCWWEIAYDIILKQGPDALSQDLWYFPALIFQVLAVALQFMPASYDRRLDELKFSSSQSFVELSQEYSDCGEEVSHLIGRPSPTVVAIQHGFLRDFWLTNAGELLQAWNHSGQTVKEAMSIGLHMEPELPASSKPGELLDALWMNEIRKRTWLNLFAWDSHMALALGRPMFIDLKRCTITAPTECEIPQDRLNRVPVPRSDSEKPIALTERLLRLRISQRILEIKELVSQGPIPKAPEKVKELHEFAVDFRNSLPACYRNKDPDTSWDASCPFVPVHRELLSFLIDSFLMALHRPYIFTRPKSQHEVYDSSLSILDSQDRLFHFQNSSSTQWFIGTTFPTFDAAVLLAVVLVSNPERYSTIFPRPYQSLQRALERLEVIGKTLPLAKTGSVTLRSTIRRVVEAHEHVGGMPSNADIAQSEIAAIGGKSRDYTTNSTEVSPDAGNWRFEVNPSELEWTSQNPELIDFDFSNLEVPMPLRELLLDDEMAAIPAGLNANDPSLWTSAERQLDQVTSTEQPGMIDVVDNSLWNFLAGYPGCFDEVNL